MPKGSLSQTYRHRETLKAYGCRWSKKRRQWYFIGRELPDEITALLGPQDTTSEPVVQTIHLRPVAPLLLVIHPD